MPRGWGAPAAACSRLVALILLALVAAGGCRRSEGAPATPAAYDEPCATQGQYSVTPREAERERAWRCFAGSVPRPLCEGDTWLRDPNFGRAIAELVIRRRVMADRAAERVDSPTEAQIEEVIRGREPTAALLDATPQAREAALAPHGLTWDEIRAFAADRARYLSWIESMVSELSEDSLRVLHREWREQVGFDIVFVPHRVDRDTIDAILRDEDALLRERYRANPARWTFRGELHSFESVRRELAHVVARERGVGEAVGRSLGVARDILETRPHRLESEGRALGFRVVAAPTGPVRTDDNVIGFGISPEAAAFVYDPDNAAGAIIDEPIAFEGSLALIRIRDRTRAAEFDFSADRDELIRRERDRLDQNAWSVWISGFERFNPLHYDHNALRAGFGLPPMHEAAPAAEDTNPGSVLPPR